MLMFSKIGFSGLTCSAAVFTHFYFNFYCDTCILNVFLSFLNKVCKLKCVKFLERMLALAQFVFDLNLFTVQIICLFLIIIPEKHTK